MPDPRDALLTRLHDRWLKPKGFRKAGRVSTRQLADGLINRVVLESAPAAPYSTCRFGLDFQATHSSFPPRKLLLTLSLRSYVERIDRWQYEPDEQTNELFNRVEVMFAHTGVELLDRMASIESLQTLLGELEVVFLSESRAWCLDQMNEPDRAMEVLRSAVANAPHERFRAHLVEVINKREKGVA